MDSFRFDLSVFKRFDLRIRFMTQFSKDLFLRFVLWRNFQKICFVDSFCDTIFKRFEESNESSQILSTIDLRIRTNPLDSDSQILWFSKDSFRGFVSWRNFQKIRFVDLFRKKKKSKRFVSYRFVRIRIRIPHP